MITHWSDHHELVNVLTLWDSCGLGCELDLLQIFVFLIVANLTYMKSL